MKFGRSTAQNQKAAFSLLEILLVITVMMTLIGLVMFSFLGKPRASLTGSAATITGLLTQARAEALRTGRPVALALHDTTPKTSVALFHLKSAPKSTGTQATPITEWITLPEQITLSSETLADGQNVLSFPPITAPAWPGDQPRLWQFPLSFPDTNLPGVVFDENGRLIYPDTTKSIDIIVRRGSWENGQKLLIDGDNASPSNAIPVRINRFTGHAAAFDMPTP